MSTSCTNYSQTINPDTSGNTIPVWYYDSVVPKFGKLLSDCHSDVVVVGAGIAGLTTAYHLLKEGLSVIVLDDGEIASGESGRTSAHLSNALDDRYFHIAKMHGEQAAGQAAESHTVAIDRIQEIVEQEQIDCEFERVDGYLFKPPGDTSNVLEREYEAARKAGLNVDWVERAPFDNIQGSSTSTQNPFDSGRCLLFPHQAIFHPVKYLGGLSRAVVRLGGRIYTQTHVDNLEGGPNARIVTSDRVTVKCNSIVQATNQPINDIITMYTKEHAYRTYVIAARVAKGSVTNALFWDTPEVYHYIRVKKMPEFDYLIVGGEDHKVGHTGHNVEEFNGRFRALEEWSRRRFPGIIDVPYRWSGQIMEPLDDMAYIGRNPGDKDNVYICTGDSGNGLTHGTIAGILLTDLIMGRQNRWAELYDPSRKNFLKNIADFAHDNIESGLTYKEYLTSGDVQDIEQIPRCSGALIRQGLTKIAVYKDADGSVCKMSAICPHLKSIVQWNDLEKSWDCPAHGSRFDRYGKVINGPSNRGLTKISPEKSAI